VDNRRDAFGMADCARFIRGPNREDHFETWIAALRGEIVMSLMDVLRQYANTQPGQTADAAADHFSEVARNAPPETLQQGIAAAFHSDQTPPFSQMVGQLFGQASQQQQAGMVQQLLGALGPAAIAGLAGSGLGKLLDGSSQLTSEQMARINPAQIQQLAEHAERQDPSIVDKMSGFYAQHPDLVKTLGGAALTIALAKIANHMKAA
jgi:hypothetical protein